MLRLLRAKEDYQRTILRNQLTSLVLYENLTTTTAKAKRLVPFANRFLHRVKLGDPLAKRLSHETLLDKNATKKIFEELLPRFKSGETNFIRITSIMPRKGDNAKQSLVTFTHGIVSKEKNEGA